MKRCAQVVVAAIVVAHFVCQSSASAQQKIRFIDLEGKMNRKLADDLGSGAPSNSLAALPLGEQELNKVKFKVGPGLVQLGSSMLDAWPDKIEGIAIDGKIAKLHILHSTCFGRGKPGDAWFVKEQTLIGQYMVHYEDASIEAIPIVYGDDVRDWWFNDNDLKELGRGKLAWTGENGLASRIGCRLRLFTSTWTNPKPDKKITRIDYTANKGETVAAPFCLAMSVEEE
jgi:hypothetical protein